MWFLQKVKINISLVYVQNQLYINDFFFFKELLTAYIRYKISYIIRKPDLDTYINHWITYSMVVSERNKVSLLTSSRASFCFDISQMLILISTN